jgi:hypothetical protein
MPTTIAVVPNSRTPESVVLQLANDGVADVGPLTLTRAALLAQLSAGPLRELLTRTASLTVFNTNSPDSRDSVIRFTQIAGGLDATIVPPLTTLVLRFVADGLEYSIFNNNGGGVASGLLVELRATHSNER